MCTRLYNVVLQQSLEVALTLTLSVVLLACGGISEPLPRGVEGPEAEHLADQILQATNAAAFHRSEGAQWSFRNHHYLWHRGLGRVRVKLDDKRTLKYHIGPSFSL